MLREMMLATPLGLAAATAVNAQPTPPVADVLDGVDPVLLLQGREVVGHESFSVTHHGYRYLFSAAETMPSRR